MSKWAYVSGIVTVDVPGRTQAECQYIVETVVNHLPKVTGSERDMVVHIVKEDGHNVSSSCDEFGVPLPGGEWMEYQDTYMLVLEGYLRDRLFDEAFREFSKWLTRLAKRIWVKDCIVRVTGVDQEWNAREKVFSVTDSEYFYQLFETPSYYSDSETVNWCEYLRWDYPRDRKGRLLKGKPDFPDGKMLVLMTDKEKARRFGRTKRGKKR